MKNKCVCISSYFLNKKIIFEKDGYYNYTEQQFVSRDYPPGYNVEFSKGEYLYFRIGSEETTFASSVPLFVKFFKTIKELRKDKLIQIKPNK